MDSNTTVNNSKQFLDRAQPLVNDSQDEARSREQVLPAETAKEPVETNPASKPVDTTKGPAEITETNQNNELNRAVAERGPVLIYNKQDHCGWCYECRDYGEGHEQQLAKDLASSFYWSGNYLKDYLFFNRNWHPLIGVFVSHPAHPWSKLHRVAALVFSGCGALFILSWSNANDIPFYHIFLKTTIPMYLVDYFMYYLLTSPIYFRNYPTCMSVLAVIGRWSINFLLLFAALLVLATLWITWFKVQPLIDETALSFAMSWVFWIPLHYFLPFFGFRWVWAREEASLQEEGHKLKNAGEVQLQEMKADPAKTQKAETIAVEKGQLAGSCDPEKAQAAANANNEKADPANKLFSW